ncbi:MAG: hypothetical protein K1X81_01795 [Bacteroidia bacterium]|nr:hypothetical protein [Bacteroidia bacterium]
MNKENLELKIVKETKSFGPVEIRPVEKALAKEMIVKNHYSHKWNEGGFGKYNFGIFKADNPGECLGVAVYGYMKNPNAKIFSHPNPGAWMSELNRMWISDVLGMNAESILIAASIKLLRRMNQDCVAIQSFADGRLGCGTIYKAANFKYYGFHYTKFLENSRTGEFTHEQIFTNTTCTSSYLRANIAYLIGDMKVYEVKTYRYIYPLCKHFRFNKPELPYPEYERGMTQSYWSRDIDKIKYNIVSMLDKVSSKK